jgi:hypothetical protein
MVTPAEPMIAGRAWAEPSITALGNGNSEV